MTDKPPLIESLRRYGSDFISHAASRGIEDIEAAGELMLAAARVLAEQPAEQEPVALLHDDGYWTAAKTDAGRRLSERLLFAGSPSIAVYTAPQPAKSAEQEPVAWMQESTEVIRSDWGFDKRGYIPLYAAPQPAKQPLTREELFEIAEPFGEFQYGDAQGHKRIDFANAIIAAYERKNVYAVPQPRRRLTDEEIDNTTRKQVDDLLDHIYEYGTAAEGIDYRVRAIARAIEAAVWGDGK